MNELSKKLEEVLKHKVVLLILHDLASITRDIVDDIEFYLQEKEDERALKSGDLCIVLHTAGGDADAAYHIAIRPQEFIGEGHKLIFLIPRFAKSAGTLLACAGNEIYLTPITELGPIDPQIYVRETGRWVSAKAIEGSLRQVIQTLREAGGLDPRAIEAIVRRIPIVELGHYDSLIEHVKRLLKDLLERRMLKEERNKAEKVAETLVKGYMYHGKVIHPKEAQRLGLKVKILKGEALKATYSLYKQVKKLFSEIDKRIGPLLTLIREVELPLAPLIEKHDIEYGLIYIPTIREFRELESIQPSLPRTRRR